MNSSMNSMLIQQCDRRHRPDDREETGEEGKSGQSSDRQNLSAGIRAEKKEDTETESEYMNSKAEDALRKLRAMGG